MGNVEGRNQQVDVPKISSRPLPPLPDDEDSDLDSPPSYPPPPPPIEDFKRHSWNANIFGGTKKGSWAVNNSLDFNYPVSERIKNGHNHSDRNGLSNTIALDDDSVITVSVTGTPKDDEFISDRFKNSPSNNQVTRNMQLIMDQEIQAPYKQKRSQLLNVCPDVQSVNSKETHNLPDVINVKHIDNNYSTSDQSFSIPLVDSIKIEDVRLDYPEGKVVEISNYNLFDSSFESNNLEVNVVSPLTIEDEQIPDITAIEKETSNVKTQVNKPKFDLVSCFGKRNKTNEISEETCNNDDQVQISSSNDKVKEKETTESTAEISQGDDKKIKIKTKKAGLGSCFQKNKSSDVNEDIKENEQISSTNAGKDTISDASVPTASVEESEVKEKLKSDKKQKIKFGSCFGTQKTKYENKDNLAIKTDKSITIEESEIPSHSVAKSELVSVSSNIELNEETIDIANVEINLPKEVMKLVGKSSSNEAEELDGNIAKNKNLASQNYSFQDQSTIEDSSPSFVVDGHVSKIDIDIKNEAITLPNIDNTNIEIEIPSCEMKISDELSASDKNFESQNFDIDIETVIPEIKPKIDQEFTSSSVEVDTKNCDIATQIIPPNTEVPIKLYVETPDDNDIKIDAKAKTRNKSKKSSFGSCFGKPKTSSVSREIKIDEKISVSTKELSELTESKPDDIDVKDKEIQLNDHEISLQTSVPSATTKVSIESHIIESKPDLRTDKKRKLNLGSCFERSKASVSEENIPVSEQLNTSETKDRTDSNIKTKPKDASIFGTCFGKPKVDTQEPQPIRYEDSQDNVSYDIPLSNVSIEIEEKCIDVSNSKIELNLEKESTESSASPGSIDIKQCDVSADQPTEINISSPKAESKSRKKLKIGSCFGKSKKLAASNKGLVNTKDTDESDKTEQKSTKSHEGEVAVDSSVEHTEEIVLVVPRTEADKKFSKKSKVKIGSCLGKSKSKDCKENTDAEREVAGNITDSPDIKEQKAKEKPRPINLFGSCLGKGNTAKSENTLASVNPCDAPSIAVSHNISLPDIAVDEQKINESVCIEAKDIEVDIPKVDINLEGKSSIDSIEKPNADISVLDKDAKRQSIDIDMQFDIPVLELASADSSIKTPELDTNLKTDISSVDVELSLPDTKPEIEKESVDKISHDIEVEISKPDIEIETNKPAVKVPKVKKRAGGPCPCIGRPPKAPKEEVYMPPTKADDDDIASPQILDENSADADISGVVDVNFSELERKEDQIIEEVPVLEKKSKFKFGPCFGKAKTMKTECDVAIDVSTPDNAETTVEVVPSQKKVKGNINKKSNFTDCFSRREKSSADVKSPQSQIKAGVDIPEIEAEIIADPAAISIDEKTESPNTKSKEKPDKASRSGSIGSCFGKSKSKDISAKGNDISIEDKTKNRRLGSCFGKDKSNEIIIEKDKPLMSADMDITAEEPLPEVEVKTNVSDVLPTAKISTKTDNKPRLKLGSCFGKSKRKKDKDIAEKVPGNTSDSEDVTDPKLKQKSKPVNIFGACLGKSKITKTETTLASVNPCDAPTITVSHNISLPDIAVDEQKINDSVCIEAKDIEIDIPKVDMHLEGKLSVDSIEQPNVDISVMDNDAKRQSIDIDMQFDTPAVELASADSSIKTPELDINLKTDISSVDVEVLLPDTGIEIEKKSVDLITHEIDVEVAKPIIEIETNKPTIKVPKVKKRAGGPCSCMGKSPKAPKGEVYMPPTKSDNDDSASPQITDEISAVSDMAGADVKSPKQEENDSEEIPVLEKKSKFNFGACFSKSKAVTTDCEVSIDVTNPDKIETTVDVPSQKEEKGNMKNKQSLSSCFGRPKKSSTDVRSSQIEIKAEVDVPEIDAESIVDPADICIDEIKDSTSIKIEAKPKIKSTSGSFGSCFGKPKSKDLSIDDSSAKGKSPDSVIDKSVAGKTKKRNMGSCFGKEKSKNVALPENEKPAIGVDVDIISEDSVPEVKASVSDVSPTVEVSPKSENKQKFTLGLCFGNSKRKGSKKSKDMEVKVSGTISDSEDIKETKMKQKSKPVNLFGSCVGKDKKVKSDNKLSPKDSYETPSIDICSNISLPDIAVDEPKINESVYLETKDIEIDLPKVNMNLEGKSSVESISHPNVDILKVDTDAKRESINMDIQLENPVVELNSAESSGTIPELDTNLKIDVPSVDIEVSPLDTKIEIGRKSTDLTYDAIGVSKPIIETETKKSTIKVPKIKKRAAGPCSCMGKSSNAPKGEVYMPPTKSNNDDIVNLQINDENSPDTDVSGEVEVVDIPELDKAPDEIIVEIPDTKIQTTKNKFKFGSCFGKTKADKSDGIIAKVDTVVVPDHLEISVEESSHKDIDMNKRSSLSSCFSRPKKSSIDVSSSKSEIKAEVDAPDIEGENIIIPKAICTVERKDSAKIEIKQKPEKKSSKKSIGSCFGKPKQKDLSVDISSKEKSSESINDKSMAGKTKKSGLGSCFSKEKSNVDITEREKPALSANVDIITEGSVPEVKTNVGDVSPTVEVSTNYESKPKLKLGSCFGNSKRKDSKETIDNGGNVSGSIADSEDVKQPKMKQKSKPSNLFGSCLGKGKTVKSDKSLTAIDPSIEVCSNISMPDIGIDEPRASKNLFIEVKDIEIDLPKVDMNLEGKASVGNIEQPNVDISVMDNDAKRKSIDIDMQVDTPAIKLDSVDSTITTPELDTNLKTDISSVDVEISLPDPEIEIEKKFVDLIVDDIEVEVSKPIIEIETDKPNITVPKVKKRAGGPCSCMGKPPKAHKGEVYLPPPKSDNDAVASPHIIDESVETANISGEVDVNITEEVPVLETKRKFNIGSCFGKTKKEKTDSDIAIDVSHNDKIEATVEVPSQKKEKGNIKNKQSFTDCFSRPRKQTIDVKSSQCEITAEVDTPEIEVEVIADPPVICTDERKINIKEKPEKKSTSGSIASCFRKPKSKDLSIDNNTKGNSSESINDKSIEGKTKTRGFGSCFGKDKSNVTISEKEEPSMSADVNIIAEGSLPEIKTHDSNVSPTVEVSTTSDNKPRLKLGSCFGNSKRNNSKENTDIEEKVLDNISDSEDVKDPKVKQKSKPANLFGSCLGNKKTARSDKRLASVNPCEAPSIAVCPDISMPDIAVDEQILNESVCIEVKDIEIDLPKVDMNLERKSSVDSIEKPNVDISAMNNDAKRQSIDIDMQFDIPVVELASADSSIKTPELDTNLKTDISSVDVELSLSDTKIEIQKKSVDMISHDIEIEISKPDIEIETDKTIITVPKVKKRAGGPCSCMGKPPKTPKGEVYMPPTKSDNDDITSPQTIDENSAAPDISVALDVNIPKLKRKEDEIVSESPVLEKKNKFNFGPCFGKTKTVKPDDDVAIDVTNPDKIETTVDVPSQRTEKEENVKNKSSLASCFSKPKKSSTGIRSSQIEIEAEVDVPEIDAKSIVDPADICIDETKDSTTIKIEAKPKIKSTSGSIGSCFGKPKSKDLSIDNSAKGQSSDSVSDKSIEGKTKKPKLSSCFGKGKSNAKLAKTEKPSLSAEDEYAPTKYHKTDMNVNIPAADFDSPIKVIEVELDPTVSEIKQSVDELKMNFKEFDGDNDDAIVTYDNEFQNSVPTIEAETIEIPKIDLNFCADIPPMQYDNIDIIEINVDENNDNVHLSKNNDMKSNIDSQDLETTISKQFPELDFNISSPIYENVDNFSVEPSFEVSTSSTYPNRSSIEQLSNDDGDRPEAISEFESYMLEMKSHLCKTLDERLQLSSPQLLTEKVKQLVFSDDKNMPKLKETDALFDNDDSLNATDSNQSTEKPPEPPKRWYNLDESTQSENSTKDHILDEEDELNYLPNIDNSRVIEGKFGPLPTTNAHIEESTAEEQDADTYDSIDMHFPTVEKSFKVNTFKVNEANQVPDDIIEGISLDTYDETKQLLDRLCTAEGSEYSRPIIKRTVKIRTYKTCKEGDNPEEIIEDFEEENTSTNLEKSEAKKLLLDRLSEFDNDSSVIVKKTVRVKTYKINEDGDNPENVIQEFEHTSADVSIADILQDNYPFLESNIHFKTSESINQEEVQESPSDLRTTAGISSSEKNDDHTSNNFETSVSTENSIKQDAQDKLSQSSVISNSDIEKS